VVDVDVPFDLSLGQTQQQTRLDDLTGIFTRDAAYATGGLNLTGGAEPARVTITYVTRDFFTTMGRTPSIGRAPVDEEFTKNGARAVVLSNGLWQRQFGGEQSAIGKTVALNGKSYRIVGVMPDDFKFPATTDLWIPLPLPFSLDIMEAF